MQIMISTYICNYIIDISCIYVSYIIGNMLEII